MSLFNLSNQQVARLVSKTVYKNLYQDIIHKDGFGITDRFITPEQTNAAIIDIYVPMPINNRFRMRGAASNGAWANTNIPPHFFIVLFLPVYASYFRPRTIFAAVLAIFFMLCFSSFGTNAKRNVIFTRYFSVLCHMVCSFFYLLFVCDLPALKL